MGEVVRVAALSLALAWSIASVSGEAKASSFVDGCPDVIVERFGERAETACYVAWRESRWDPNAISPTDDWGLFQVNRPSHGWHATLDPVANTQYAYELSEGGTNWCRHWAWVCQ